MNKRKRVDSDVLSHHETEDSLVTMLNCLLIHLRESRRQASSDTECVDKHQVYSRET